VLTKAIRQTLLDGLNVYTSLKNSLKSKLANNDLAGFDTGLLGYMTSRSNVHFFFDIGNAGTIAHKTLSCNGNLCFVAALNQTIIPDGTVAIATFHIAPKPFAQSIPIQISGVVAASAVAQSIPVKSVSGTIALLSNGWVRRFLDCSIWATLIPRGTTTSARSSDL